MGSFSIFLQCADSSLVLQLQCSIFSTTFNPMQQRLGNKVLRQRLRGPALAAYYPRRSATVEDVLKEFKRFDLEGFNEEEDDRLENVAFAKLRGKGAPKKKRTAAGTIYLVSEADKGTDHAYRKSDEQEKEVIKTRTASSRCITLQDTHEGIAVRDLAENWFTIRTLLAGSDTQAFVALFFTGPCSRAPSLPDPCLHQACPLC
jgi:small subunit ribosomal protein S33